MCTIWLHNHLKGYNQQFLKKILHHNRLLRGYYAVIQTIFQKNNDCSSEISQLCTITLRGSIEIMKKWRCTMDYKIWKKYKAEMSQLYTISLRRGEIRTFICKLRFFNKIKECQTKKVINCTCSFWVWSSPTPYFQGMWVTAPTQLPVPVLWCQFP